jgi:hypothetical protein
MLNRWERWRAKGALRIVLMFTFLYAALMVTIPSIRDYFVYKLPFSSDELLFRIVVYVFVGLLLGGLFWVGNESRYHKLRHRKSVEHEP